MHFNLDPLAVPDEAYRFGVNLRLDRQALGQRHGAREVPLRSATDGLVEEFQALNFQGAIRYSPSKGQSALQFASKADYIAIAAAGRKFLVEVVGRGAAMYGNLQEITGDAPQAPDLHMSWMGQAENYLLAGDDFGSTYIYDGVGDAELSSGYDPVTPENSRLPNRSRLPVYTHGRVATVVGANAVLIGDIIHGESLTTASDLLNFKEQVYWASGAEFKLPTDAGAILALYNLPTTGTSTSHGELVIEAEERTYVLRTNIFPRTSWIDTPNMMPTVSAEGGARGPWAFDVYSDDAVRRTLNGIETLSFAQRSGDLIYSPQELLSHQIDDFLEGDYGPLLRFNQTKVHRKVKRLYTTVRPWTSGYHWKHRGVATYNYLRKVWEGVNIYPELVKDIKGLVPMRMSGEARMFMIAGNDQLSHSIRILEIDERERSDHLAEGEFPIQSAVYTRAVYGDLKDRIQVDDGELQFDRVVGNVDYKVSWKSDWSQGCWNPWTEGSRCQDPSSAPGVKPVELGAFPGKEVNGVRLTSARHFEFLIQWSGKADLRFHSVNMSTDRDDSKSIIDEDDECLVDTQCYDNPLILWQ